MEVQAETDFAKAQRFTSPDGATFAVSPDGFHDFAFKNGWTVADGITGVPAARKIGNIVHLTGAMQTSLENNTPFKLAKAFRPSHRAYAKLDLCAATTGGMTLDADGSVHVYPEGDFSDAQCFTSLEGVSYSVDGEGFTALTLINGWTNWSETANSAAKAANGIVQFQGLFLRRAPMRFRSCCRSDCVPRSGSICRSKCASTLTGG